jgi:hypothetical protein
MIATHPDASTPAALAASDFFVDGRTPRWCDGSMERAHAALQLGMKVPEVEQLLVAKGLTLAQANEVVMALVE